jgi:hypothetical protein
MTTRCQYYIQHCGEEPLAPLPGDEVNERDNAPDAIFPNLGTAKHSAHTV